MFETSIAHTICRDYPRNASSAKTDYESGYSEQSPTPGSSIQRLVTPQAFQPAPRSG